MHTIHTQAQKNADIKHHNTQNDTKVCLNASEKENGIEMSYDTQCILETL